MTNDNKILVQMRVYNFHFGTSVILNSSPIPIIGMAPWILCLVLGSAVFLVSVGLWVKGRPAIRTVKNKHVFITGGSMGIGFELAKEALLQEAFVTITARSADRLRKAVEELKKLTHCSPDRISYQVADIGNYKQISEAVNASHSWRAIDVLLCNAGASKSEFFEETSVEDINMIIQTNLSGTLYTIHAALPLMKKKPTSQTRAIMIVASLASLFNTYGHSVYTATKYAQRGLAEALRLELLPDNISVGISCPGFTDTPMLEKALAEIPPSLLAMVKVLNLYHERTVEKAKDVAKYTLDGIKKGSFLSTTAMPGFLLGTLSRGVFPADSFTGVIAELILYVPLRLLSFIIAGLIVIVLPRLHRKVHYKSH